MWPNRVIVAESNLLDALVKLLGALVTSQPQV